MVGVVRAIPPPPGMKLEGEILVVRKGLCPREVAAAQADSERRALNDYYAEPIWFPYHDKVWINTWDRADIPKDAGSYPGGWGKILQFVEPISMQVLQKTPMYCKLAYPSQLEIGKDPAEKIDFTNVQRAWWDAIILKYAISEKAPMCMPLDVRIMD
ncbi:hypothetical protein MMC27_000876 [Xylographa pallens]|nr:hypothetical protein [Xylographa pallens]